MKTLVRDNISLYLLDDDEAVVMTEQNIIIGSPPRFIVADCNSSNTTLFEGVTAPADWTGWKYMFDGSNWTLNPDFVMPE